MGNHLDSFSQIVASSFFAYELHGKKTNGNKYLLAKICKTARLINFSYQTLTSLYTFPDVKLCLAVKVMSRNLLKRKYLKFSYLYENLGNMSEPLIVS